MTTRTTIVILVLVCAGIGGGYLAGARARPGPESGVPAATGMPAPGSGTPGPKSTSMGPRAAPAPGATVSDARLRALEARLAACDAAREEADRAEQRARDLLAARERAHDLSERRRGLASCRVFQEQIAPRVDEELGPLAPTQEEERAARAMPLSECSHVVAWSMMAASHRALCLRALDDPPDVDLADGGAGYRETCEQTPIDERPLVKACRARHDVKNALLAEAWARQGLAGTPRVTPEGGIRVYPPGVDAAP